MYDLSSKYDNCLFLSNNSIMIVCFLIIKYDDCLFLSNKYDNDLFLNTSRYMINVAVNECKQI